MKIFQAFIIVLSMLTVFSCSKKAATEVFQAKVILTVGDVKIDGYPVQPGSPVLSNSVIITGKDSSCEIVFNEKNILHIFEDSSLALDMRSLHKVLKVQSGGLEAVVKNLGSSKDESLAPFEVQTTTAVAAVRGTTFYVRVLDASNTALCACNGVVEISNPGQTNKQVVESSHHSGFVFTSGTNGLVYKPVNLSFKNEDEMKKLAGHNDRELEELAAKIGVKIDWTKPDHSIR